MYFQSTGLFSISLVSVKAYIPMLSALIGSKSHVRYFRAIKEGHG